MGKAHCRNAPRAGGARVQDAATCTNPGLFGNRSGRGNLTNPSRVTIPKVFAWIKMRRASPGHNLNVGSMTQNSITSLHFSSGRHGHSLSTSPFAPSPTSGVGNAPDLRLLPAPAGYGRSSLERFDATDDRGRPRVRGKSYRTAASRCTSFQLGRLTLWRSGGCRLSSVQNLRLVG